MAFSESAAGIADVPMMIGNAVEIRTMSVGNAVKVEIQKINIIDAVEIKKVKVEKALKGLKTGGKKSKVAPKASKSFGADDSGSLDQKSFHKCLYCSKVYTWKQTLTRHIADSHSEVTGPVSCDLCGKQYKNRSSLINHSANGHCKRSSVFI